MTNYIGIIHKDNDSDYGISFPDFPGCFSAGSTMEEVRNMAKEALDMHIELLIDDGEIIPEPTDLDTIMLDPENTNGAAIVVEYKKAIETVKFNGTANKEDLKTIDTFAKKNGYTRSGFLIHTALNHIKVDPRVTKEKLKRNGLFHRRKGPRSHEVYKAKSTPQKESDLTNKQTTAAAPHASE